MKFLVTGANGQLGKEFQKVLKDFNYGIVALGKEDLDMADLDKVKDAISRYNPDVILNCAAYNFVEMAEEDFDIAYNVNAAGPRNLAFACRKKKILLVHFSTDYVFDGTKEDFYTEQDRPGPINNYGKSKLLGEEFLKEESDNYLIFRLSWVFGEGKQNFLYKLLEWAKQKRVLKIVSDQISVPTFTGDVASITMFALNKGLRGLYHLTSSGYASRYEVARYFIEKLSLDNLVLPVSSDYFPSPARRPYFSAMSNLKLSKELNIDIPDWRLGIDRYIKTIT
ncbi:MAG: dTDP-4-dehydrorhamnose reductase [Nitrospirae bacterium]|jgi:dTDP-4-dehydrorhamnose reductase|nr:dTDP-4-dehydrorhamnose reductase [Nitrospirota bacterium]